MMVKIKENKVAPILFIIIISRFLAEIVNNYVFDRANYIWSLMMLGLLPLIVFPILFIITKKEKNIVKDYSPILIFLIFQIIRTEFTNSYSLKCALAECIVWTSFILTIEVCKRDAFTLEKLEKIFVYIAKFIIILGAVQFILSVKTNGVGNISQVYNSRVVSGIFDHPNTFLICIIPFSLYFFKNRNYGWFVISVLTCLFTGTRGPVLSAACLSLLMIKSFFNKPITKKDIVFSLVIIIVAYTLLIRSNMEIVEYEDYYSRNNAASLQWRISHWAKFLEFSPSASFWFGHGVGAADLYPNSFGINTYPINLAPHNDYIKTFYDLGIIGLLLFLNMILFIIRLIYKNLNKNNDIILIGYLIIVCFLITDNFIYFTSPLFIFMFIAVLLYKNKGESLNLSISAG
ncbi:MAG: hypothetical protein GY874_20830 [Desulfobacteraceae bacterium]|nr:hypothetical protein [Desulfobacteraceae bacterium]